MPLLWPAFGPYSLGLSNESDHILDKAAEFCPFCIAVTRSGLALLGNTGLLSRFLLFLMMCLLWRLAVQRERLCCRFDVEES